MSTAPQRIGNIDLVRGVAAILVMLQHSLEHAGIESIGQPGFGFTWLNLGQTGVVAFFLVSGFVIPLSLERWNSLSTFWFSRVCRLYPLYLFALLVSWFAYREGFSARSIVAHLLFLQEYAGVKNLVANSWTLSLEMVWYLLFSALFLVGLNRNSKLLTALIVFAIAAGTAISLLGGPKVPIGRLGLIATCVIGLLSYRVSKRETVSTCVSCMLIVAVATAIGLYVRFALFPKDAADAPSFRCVACSWSLGFALFGISFFRLPLARMDSVFRFLGTISYSIYILHTYAFWILDATDIRGWPYVFAVACMTISASFVTYRLIEQPGITLSHSVTRRQRLPLTPPLAAASKP
jgi:peptidoglycan/LPS O-acetylase OafA/YrhL